MKKNIMRPSTDMDFSRRCVAKSSKVDHMQRLLISLIILIYPVFASAMTGVVSQVDVCRIGNVIFKTSSGLYVNARQLSGDALKEGELVSGKLKTYGIQTILTSTGRKGNYYILDFKSNRMDAVNAHCAFR